MNPTAWKDFVNLRHGAIRMGQGLHLEAPGDLEPSDHPQWSPGSRRNLTQRSPHSLISFPSSSAAASLPFS